MDTPVWQEEWKNALAESAGIAPYLEEGVKYVEDMRCADAERLSRFARRFDVRLES